MCTNCIVYEKCISVQYNIAALHITIACYSTPVGHMFVWHFEYWNLFSAYRLSREKTKLTKLVSFYFTHLGEDYPHQYIITVTHFTYKIKPRLAQNTIILSSE